MRFYRSTGVMWASTHYLTQPLPIEYLTWTDQEIYDYCEMYALALYEYSPGYDIFGEITFLARDAEEYFLR